MVCLFIRGTQNYQRDTRFSFFAGRDNRCSPKWHSPGQKAEWARLLGLRKYTIPDSLPAFSLPSPLPLSVQKIYPVDAEAPRKDSTINADKITHSILFRFITPPLFSRMSNIVCAYRFNSAKGEFSGSKPPLSGGALTRA